jgi:hypothetical protein
MAPVTPDAGELKSRPAVVLSTNDEIKQTGRALLIGVTSSFFQDAHFYFELPWRVDGNVATGFKEPSAAKRTMIQEFNVDALKPTRRFVSKVRMTALLDWLEQGTSS